MIVAFIHTLYQGSFYSLAFGDDCKERYIGTYNYYCKIWRSISKIIHKFHRGMETSNNITTLEIRSLSTFCKYGYTVYYLEIVLQYRPESVSLQVVSVIKETAYMYV